MAITSDESIAFSNISATTAAFNLQGGTYSLVISALFGTGNVALQALAIDGSTFVAVGSGITTNSIVTFTLPPGQYRLQINGNTTVVFADLTRSPA
jgi:hypothetical protein